MTGMVPREGDIVHITDRAAKRFAEAPVDRFRVVHADVIDGRPGWCRIRGWDMDVEPQTYVAYDVWVNGLIIRPGNAWVMISTPTPGSPE